MKIFRAMLVALIGVALFPVGAEAAISIKSYDTSKNGLLERNEIERLRAGITPDTYAEEAHYLGELERLEKLMGRGNPIPVEMFKAYTDFEKCNKDQRFFLRRNLDNASLLSCKDLSALPKGASLSFSKDQEAGETNIELKGVIVYYLPGSENSRPRRERGASGPYLSGVAFAAFVEADGTFVSGGTNEGYVRTGILGEFFFEGLSIEGIGIQVKPYYQTDLGLEGSGYGLQATITPFSSRHRFNLFVEADRESKRRLQFQGNFAVDAFNVTKTGTGSLQSGDEFAWVGGNLGVLYEDNSFFENGFTFEAGLSHFHDFIGGHDATLGVIGLSLNLDKKGMSSIALLYERGRKRQTFKKVDKLSLTYQLKI